MCPDSRCQDLLLYRYQGLLAYKLCVYVSALTWPWGKLRRAQGLDLSVSYGFRVGNRLMRAALLTLRLTACIRRRPLRCLSGGQAQPLLSQS